MTAISHTSSLRAQFAASDRRTRRFTTASLIVHAVLLAWWALAQHIAPIEEELVEITWIEPEPEPEPLRIAKSTPAPPVAEPEPVAPPEPVAETPVAREAFERPEPVAPVEPVPQRPTASTDRLERSLNALKTAPPKASVSAVATSPTATPSRAPATVATPATPRPTQNLTRGTAPTAPKPQTLARSTKPSVPGRSSLAQAKVPNAAGPSTAERSDADMAIRRSIDGAILKGQVADRALVARTMPIYPERARREAVEATVELGFTVMPDGRVKPDIRVERGSGHADFDQSAMDALRTWRFEALPSGNRAEQWGVITFQFRLRDR